MIVLFISKLVPSLTWASYDSVSKKASLATIIRDNKDLVMLGVTRSCVLSTPEVVEALALKMSMQQALALLVGPVIVDLDD